MTSSLVTPRRIQSGALSAAILAAAQRCKLPTTQLPVGTSLLRAVEALRLGLILDGTISRQKANECVVVRDTDRDANRFTGVDPTDGRGGQGGVYFSLASASLAAELRHYAKPTGTRRLTADALAVPPGGVERRRTPALRSVVVGQKCVLYAKTQRSLDLLDLGGQVEQWRRLAADPEVKQALALASHASLRNAIMSSDDYSAARAVGLAAARSGLAGVLVPTARRVVDGGASAALNVVLFGVRGQPVAHVEIVGAAVFPLGSVRSASVERLALRS